MGHSHFMNALLVTNNVILVIMYMALCVVHNVALLITN